MKFKYLIMALAAAVIIAAAGMLIMKPSLPGRPAAKADALRGSKRPPAGAVTAKKTFAKDMGGLNVRALNIRNRPNAVKIKAFKSEGPKSGVYVRSFVSG